MTPSRTARTTCDQVPVANFAHHHETGRATKMPANAMASGERVHVRVAVLTHAAVKAAYNAATNSRAGSEDLIMTARAAVASDRDRRAGRVSPCGDTGSDARDLARARPVRLLPARGPAPAQSSLGRATAHRQRRRPRPASSKRSRQSLALVKANQPGA